MPFGIKSAPEIFQRRMHEVLNGLENVHVVVDDILIVGKGETYEMAAQNDDKIMEQLL